MATEIRSYRAVFDLERRIYQVDRLRLNPSGVPVRGAVYCLALVAMALVAAKLPLLGALVRVAPWYLRDLAGPLGAATLLCAMRFDGRPFHEAAGALVRYAVGPRLVHGDGCTAVSVRRWRPGELLVLPDGSEARLRRLRCLGPVSVRVAVAHERMEWRQGRGRTRVTVRELPGRGAPRQPQAVVLGRGARLSVMGAPGAAVRGARSAKALSAHRGGG
jgi:hypothetical protein